jgi:hypothetical protein
MNGTDQLLEDVLKGRFEEWPFALYCTTLEGGSFEYINAAFEKLIGCERDYLLKNPDCTAASLYADGNVRNAWRRKISKQRTVVYYAELQRPWDLTNMRRLFVLDCARLYPRDNADDLVVGVFVDVTKFAIGWQLSRRRLKVLTKILDSESVGLGVHRIDRSGRLLWINRAERKNLAIQDNWLEEHRDVSMLSETDHDAKLCRTNRKTWGINPLTIDQHRTFRTQDGKKTPRPVNIRDFGIRNPEGGGHKYREIYTTVKDEQISSELKAVLKEFGPHNPLLEEVDIRTFLKVQRKYAGDLAPSSASNSDHDLVFVYGNAQFIDELKRLKKAGLISLKIDSEKDIYGKSDYDFFPEHAGAYLTADERAMKGEFDERIEKHPTSTKMESIDVQVFKLPLHQNDGSGPIIGVQCFYWPAARTGLVRQHLERLYNPADALLDAPVAIFRKVRQADDIRPQEVKHRFTYANKAFLTQVQNAIKDPQRKAQFSSISTIIGKTYGDIFDDKWAKKYEADDDLVLRGLAEHTREGMVGNLVVEVKKTPIKLDDGRIVGLQGVVFKLTDWGVPRKRVSVNMGKRQIRIVGEEGPISFSAATDEWYLFDILCQHLDDDDPVTYEDIYAYLPSHSGFRTIQGQELEKAKGSLHSLKNELLKALQQTDDRLRDRFKIVAIPKVGYKMTYTEPAGEN